MNKKLNILLIGAGSWGTTLAVVLAEKEHSVYLWVRRLRTLKEIDREKRNKKYSPGLILSSNIEPFHSWKDLELNPDIIIFAVPSHALRTVINKFKPYLNNMHMAKAVVNVAKGLEKETNLRLSEVMYQTLPMDLRKKIAVLSGPNISLEIGKKLPSVSTIASKNNQILQWLQGVFSTDYFRVYTNNDIIGVEIGGAVKNIIAIAAGISDGLGYGTNTKASLVTRGLSEISRLGQEMGARAETFAGISGMGDLITTCFSLHSRNRLLGYRIGCGENPEKAKNEMFMVAEGFNTAYSVYHLSKTIGIDMPIVSCVYDILYNGMDPSTGVENLMGRKFKSEI